MPFDGCIEFGALLGETPKSEVRECVQDSFWNFVSSFLVIYKTINSRICGELSCESLKKSQYKFYSSLVSGMYTYCRSS